MSIKLRVFTTAAALLCVVVAGKAQTIPRQAQIVAGEYFVGTDPGVGKGTSIPISSPSTAVTESVLNLNIAPGQTVFFRFKNANGLWTAPRGITFTGTGVNRNALISYAEYFVGSDPGQGKGTSVSITSSRNVSLNLPSVGLTPGQFVHLRIRDDQGRWSAPVALRYPSRSIAAAEVVVGNNPNAIPLGQGIPMTPISGSFGTGIVNVQANVSGWNGTDTIWVRARSSDSLWSNPVGSVSVSNPIPTVTSSLPNAATRLQTLSVQITGTHFLPGKTTVSFGSDIMVNSVSVSSGTQITANITAPATALLGSHNVYISNPAPGGGMDTLLNVLTITNPSPSLTRLQPSVVYRLQMVNDTLTGGNFISGITTAKIDSSISISSASFMSSSQLVLKLGISASALLGTHNVIVTNSAPGGGIDTLKNALTVENPRPSLSGVSPSSVFRGDTASIQLNGANFLPEISTVSVGPGIFVDTSFVVSQSQISMKISIPDSSMPGERPLFVTNASPGGGNSDTLAFSVADVPPSPSQLLSPGNMDTVQLSSPPVQVIFSWQRSTDRDVMDTVRYVLRLTGPGIDSLFAAQGDTTDTTGMMPLLKPASYYGWVVYSTDGYTQVASIDSFVFRTSDKITDVNNPELVPKSFALYQNYPNPFNPTTTIEYDIAKRSNVSVIIYDVLGREVTKLVNQVMNPGRYKAVFNASDLPSGVYFYRITAGSFVETKKLILIK